MKRVNRRKDKILGARSVKELMLLLAPIAAGLKDLKETTERLLKSVSSSGKRSTIQHIALAAREVELGALDKGPSQKRSAKSPSVKSTLSTFKAPDMSDLIRDNENLAELTDNIRDLDVAEQMLLGNSMANLPSRDVALKQVRKIRDEARKVLDTHLKAMSKLSNKNTPSQHKAVVKATVDFIKTQLNDTDYSNMTNRSFIYSPKGQVDILYYQTYILIEDFVNHEGDIYDRYAVVITGVLDMDTGALVHHATSIKDHLTPGSFKIGPEVETFSALKRRINTLFNVDSFRVRGTRSPIPYKGEYLRKNTALPTASPHITKRTVGGKEIEAIRVKGDSIYIQLESFLTDAQETEALGSILASLRNVLVREVGGRRQAVLTSRKMKGRTSGKTWYMFSVNSTKRSDTELTSKKLNTIAETLNLTPEQVASIRQGIMN